MKFLIDENIGEWLINYLRNNGHDVKSVSKFFSSSEIYEWRYNIYFLSVVDKWDSN
jgi:hypothetical protein